MAGNRRWSIILASSVAAAILLSAAALAGTGPQTAERMRTQPSFVPSPLELHSRKVSPPASPEVTPTATAIASAVPAAQPPRPASTPFPFQAGVNFLVYGNDPAFAAKVATQLDHLAQLHVTSVSFVFPIYQTSWTASNVYADATWTPTSTNMRIFFRAAHLRHIRVMLRPLMDEAAFASAGKWRGAIAPTNTGAWFRSYTSLLVAYAQLAQSEHVEAIDIGTEFDSLQPYTQQWLNMLAAVRAAYHGELTYSANWAIQFPSFGWALDFIGVDAFFPLSAPSNATQAQLVAAWSPWIARVNGFAYRFGKPVVFTELGTTPEVSSFQSPWLWGHGTGLSLETQRLYYAASCQALKGRIGGIYWWEYLLDPLPSPSTDLSFDPEGKPADTEISRCYS